MNDEFVRKLPFSLIAEQSLLGSILVDPESLNDVAEIVGAGQREAASSVLLSTIFSIVTLPVMVLMLPLF